MGSMGEKEESNIHILGLGTRASGGATDPNRIEQRPGVVIFLSDLLTLLLYTNLERKMKTPSSCL